MLETTSEGVSEQAAKLARADKIFKKRFKQAMGKGIVVLTSAWRRDTPLLTGRYRNSLAGEIKAGLGGVEVQGIIATDVTNRGFPYPAALEESSKYHYRAGPRAGQKTQGHVKRVVKKTTKKVTGFFQDAAKKIVKDLEV